MFDDRFYDEFDERDLPSFYEKLFDSLEGMPQRPLSHELETESKHFLRSILPFSWVIHEPKEDYGEDLRVEIFAKGRATGLEFIVQLKATDQLTKRRNEVIQRVPVKTVVYLLSKEVPSLLVVYGSRAKMVYWMWIKEYVENRLQLDDPDWTKKRTVTFKIPEENSFRYRTIDEIVSYLFFRRMPDQIEPWTLIELLSTSVMMVDQNRLRNWLKKGHYQELVRFLESADVRTMLAQGALTWDDVYSLCLIWDLSESTKTAALRFAQDMAVALVEQNDLDYAARIIEVTCWEDMEICHELSSVWWRKWAEQPILELAFPDMIERLPQGSVCERYVKNLKALLRERFGAELDRVGERLESRDMWSWGAGYSSEEGRVIVNASSSAGEFIPWLLWHAGRHSSQVKKLVDLLEFGPAIGAQLYELIDDEELFWFEETAH